MAPLRAFWPQVQEALKAGRTLRLIHKRLNLAVSVRSATENACADISSGVDDTIRCQNTEPKTVRWLKKAD